MRLSVISGAVLALLTGVAIAVQSTISSRVGGQIGDIRTGILTNLMGGIIAGSVMLVWLLKDGPADWKLPSPVIGLTMISGLLGVLIITGISFSLQRAGIAAGIAGVIFGQLILSTLIDSLGIGGVEAIPFNYARGSGLLAIGLGVYLLLPKG